MHPLPQATKDVCRFISLVEIGAVLFGKHRAAWILHVARVPGEGGYGLYRLGRTAHSLPRERNSWKRLNLVSRLASVCYKLAKLGAFCVGREIGVKHGMIWWAFKGQRVWGVNLIKIGLLARTLWQAPSSDCSRQTAQQLRLTKRCLGLVSVTLKSKAAPEEVIQTVSFGKQLVVVIRRALLDFQLFCPLADPEDIESP